MRISELLQKESIALGRKPQDKADAIGQMVELLAKSGSLEDKKKFKQAILERERLSTTGIGEGIAIPHGKSSAVKRWRQWLCHRAWISRVRTVRRCIYYS